MLAIREPLKFAKKTTEIFVTRLCTKYLQNVHRKPPK